jgi:hypothetical protein
MSSRPSERRSTRGGYTLLECEVALIVLVLLVAGLMNLSAAHQRLLGHVDEWLADEPGYYVARPDETAALLGAPGRLSIDPPPPPLAATEGVYAVTVLSVSQTLDPPAAAAQVALTEN